VSARVSGPLTPRVAARLFRLAARAMRTAGTAQCLIDLRRAALQLSVLQLYDAPKWLVACGIARTDRLAILCADSVADYGFLETVCVNNGYGLRVCSGQSDARRWVRDGVTRVRVRPLRTGCRNVEMRGPQVGPSGRKPAATAA
jgi:hypothetical protein